MTKSKTPYGLHRFRKSMVVAAVFVSLVFARYTGTIRYFCSVLLLFFAGYAFVKINHKNILYILNKDTIFSVAFSFAMVVSAHMSEIFAPLGERFIFIGYILLFIVMFVIVRYFFWAIQMETRLFTKETVIKNHVILGLKYVMPIMISSFIMWSLHYPSRTSADTVSQWKQIHGEIPFSSVHAVGHTLFLKVLIMIRDSYSIVIFVQILMVSMLLGAVFVYFHKKGVHPYLLMLISLVAAFNETFLEIIVCPYKDNPYTICVILITFSLIRIVLDKGELSLFWRILTGLSIAGAWLMRHNGILIFFVSLIIFLYYCFHYSFKKYLPVVVISIATVLCVNFIAFNLMGAISQNDGTPYAIFGDGIVSVVVHNGNITDEQMERIEEIFPLDFVKETYRWGAGQNLLWSGVSVGPEGYEIGPYKSALRLHSAEIVKLYFELLPQNISIMAFEILGSTKRIWEVTNDIIGDNFFELILIVVGMLCVIRRKKASYLLPFLPVLTNIVSIAISATTNEDRYLLPTNLLFLVLVVYSAFVYQKMDLQEKSISNESF